MPKRSSTPKGREINSLAYSIVEHATNSDAAADSKKNPAAVTLGRMGGAKGGPARAASLSKSRRREIAQNAAVSRWQRQKNNLPPQTPQ